MTTWRRTRSAPARSAMGATVVHNSDGEPVVLRGALVLVWDALADPRTDDEICGAFADASDDAGLRRHVADALAALAAVGLVSGST